MTIKQNTSKSALLIVFAIPLIMILVSASRMLSLPVDPVHDQKYFITAGIFYPPYLEYNLSCVYVLKIYNFLAPHNLLAYNAGVMIIAMTLYLTAGALLLWSMTGRAHTALYALFMMLLYTSRFIFLWSSKELIAGAFLMLALWSIAKRMSFPVVAIFIVLFSFAKPDLIFSGAIVGIFLAFAQGNSWRGRIINLCVLVGLVILVLVPAYLQSGLQAMLPQGYALYCLGQHYAALIASHQVTPVRLEPWLEYKKFFNPVWGEHKSVWEAIRSHPGLYRDFIFLSLGRTTQNLCKSFLIFLLLPAAYGLVTAGKSQLKTVAALFLTGLIPMLLLSWMHVRYAARFYPVFLVLVLLWLQILEKKGGLYRGIIIYLCCIVTLQIYFIIPVFQSAYWFPD